MTPIAYGRYNPAKKDWEFRRDPFKGFKPLVLADTLPKPTPTPAEVARLATAMGWLPPPDRQQLVRSFLEDRQLGATRDELRIVIGLKQVLRVLNPMRARGELKCWPNKGRGVRWYLVKYEAHIQKYAEEKRQAQKEQDREQALARWRLNNAWLPHSGA